MKIMMADRPISVLHHLDREYTPNKAGEFEIADHHVDEVRAHGLVLKEEFEAKKKAKGGTKAVDDLVAENAALKTEIAELKKAKA